MNFCFFHKYKKIGEQNSTFVSINGVPVSRDIFKCKKCGIIKYNYNFVGLENNDITDWKPKIDLNDTLSETRKKKLKKLKRL